MISVIIPAYNAAEVLPACLQALKNQTRPPDEVLVVDDASSDGTAEAARAHGARVLTVAHGGPAAARNAGLRAAVGEYILFTDADCEPAPEWAAELLAALVDPRVSGVKGSYRTRQREVAARLAQCEFEERYDLLERAGRTDFVDSHSAAYRAPVLRAVDGFDAGLITNEDVDLSYRLAQAGYELRFNRRAVVYHRHRARWLDYLRLKISRGYWRMLVYRMHPGKAVRDTYTPQALKAQVVLAGLLLVLLLWLPFLPAAGWGVLACAALFAWSARPFLAVVRRTDPGVWPWAMPFLLVRALAFVLGVAAGLVGMFFFHPRRG